MKKFLTLMLSMFMILCVGMALTACSNGEHTHDYETSWSKNETHHWHACNVEGCDSVFDKEKHLWDEGVVENTGTLFTCTVCNATKTEPLQSMTKEEWSAMLDMSNFDNFTLLVSPSPYGYGSEPDGALTEMEIMYTGTYLSYALFVNGNVVESVASGENDSSKEELELFRNAFIADVISMVSASYDKVEYNAEANVYNVVGTVNTTYVVTSPGMVGEMEVSVTMTNGVIKVSENGKLISLECDYTAQGNGVTATIENASWTFTY